MNQYLFSKFLRVIKIGGSFLGPEENWHTSKDWIEKVVNYQLQANGKLILTVSAFKGVTRQLKAQSLAEGNPEGSFAEAGILSDGESYSSQCLFEFLRDCGFNVGLVPVSEVPIITTNLRGCGEDVLDVDDAYMYEKLMKYDILVFPGFIGRTIDGFITTLDFDGSDFTAMLLAVRYGTVCVYYKDKDGVYTANPDKVPNAVMQEYLSTNDALKLALYGSKIIHPTALRYAKFNNLTSIVTSGNDRSVYTTISNDVPDADIAGVTYKKLSGGRVQISAVGKGVDGSLRRFLIKRGYQEVGLADTAYKSGIDSAVVQGADYESALNDAHNYYCLKQ